MQMFGRVSAGCEYVDILGYIYCSRAAIAATTHTHTVETNIVTNFSNYSASFIIRMENALSIEVCVIRSRGTRIAKTSSENQQPRSGES